MQLPDEMYTNYVMRRIDDFDQLSTALKSSDAVTFKKIGHQLKGNASSFGFDDLADIGKRMNLITPENFSSEASILLQDFKSWLDATRLKYKL